MSDIKNVLLVGVGGQGTILASKILSSGLVMLGYDVKMSEIHGMSQRGGSVSTQIRYGAKVFSPIIGKGEADLLVSFETMETARWLDYLKPEAKIVANMYQIPPASVLFGNTEYPQTTLKDISEKANLLCLDAAKIANELGNGKVMNIVILGTLVKILGLDKLDWHELLSGKIKPNLVEINIKAFEAGAALVK